MVTKFFFSGLPLLQTSGRVYSLIAWILLLLVSTNSKGLIAQSMVCQGPDPSSAFHIPPLLLQSGDNTYVAHGLLYRLKQELAKRGYLNLDSVLVWGNEATQLFSEEGLSSRLAQINNMLGQAHMEKNKASVAREYYLEAIDQAKIALDARELVRAYMKHGWSFIYGNHYDTAIAYTERALILAKQIRDTSLVIDVYRNLPRIHYINQDFLNAYKTSTALIEISETANDAGGYIYGNHIVSDIYGDLGLYEKQIKQMHYCLSKVHVASDSASLYTIYSTAFRAYINSGMSDSAIYYAKLLLPIAKRLNLENVGIDKLADAFFAASKLDSARVYYEKSVANNKLHGNYIDTYKYLNLGKIEFALGNVAKAFSFYQLAEANLEKATPEIQSQIYKALYEYHNHSVNYAVANEYLECYLAMSDQLHSSTGIALLENEAALLANKIELLSKDNELHTAVVYRQRQQNRIVYSATAIILLLSGVAFYRFKKHREIKNKEALAMERLRISRDLHDEVGSALSGIAMYTHVAQGQLESQQVNEVKRSLVIMQTSAREMIGKLSDIVWLINPDLDTIAELVDRLEHFAMQMTRANNMKFDTAVPEKFADIHIPLEVRRNIYLFCKEAINNAVKYSGGSAIHLHVSRDHEGIRFSVSDDGKGFDEITIRNGNGLRNMRKRAEEIGALAEFAFGQGKGTKVEMYYKMAN